jgi:ketosteroid isomerase-like protein
VGTATDPITDALVERARDVYRMFVEQDPAFLDALDPEVEWHVPETFPGGGGAFHGTWDVLACLEAIGKLFDARPDPEEFLSAGDTLIVLGTWRARARVTGLLVKVPFAHVQRFGDGKLVYYRNYIDSAQPLKALEA